MAIKTQDRLPTEDLASPHGRKVETAAVNMLAADLLVVDERISFPSDEKLKNISPTQRDQYARLEELIGELLAKKASRRGDKISIDAEDFKALSMIMAGLPVKKEAGGATADILTTIKHLLGDKMNADFIGVAGHDDISEQLLIEDIRKSGITLTPGASPDGKSATSFIFNHADGKHTIITYPGNAAKKLRPDSITDERIAKSDTVFLPISLWSKFEDNFPETLLQKAIAQDKNIILSIPKQARFGYEGAEDIHKRLITHADVIVADEAELARWYKTDNDVERAVTLLQADMAQRDKARTAAGKPPRGNPVTAFIKHKDDSATVLVAQSPPARYEIAAPLNILPERHTLGVDDAMYAGFITALQCGMTPEKAGYYAMAVGQTKFLYDNVRIPSPVGADKATQKQWNMLRSGLADSLAELEGAISYARTGVGNAANNTLARTPGQKGFDFGLYPLLANAGVFGLSAWVTYHSNFNQNKANAFVKRSAWFKDQLAKIPGIGKSPQMVRNLNMVAWSFIDGSAMAPIVAALESKRQPISRWIDDKLGTTPEDTSVYEQEIQRSWRDIIKARATTAGMVLATYFALNTKLFPRSVKEGILNETAINSGIFHREAAQSVNGFVFDVPSKKIGGWLSDIPWVRNWAQQVSDKQLSGMAAKTGTIARKATGMDARYQIEGAVNTGLFEAVYTSLCTAGLYFLGKAFASKRKQQENISDTETQDAGKTPIVPTINADTATENAESLRATGDLKTKRPVQHKNYRDRAEHTRREIVQAGI